MKVTKEHLTAAVDAQIIHAEQAEALFQFLKQCPSYETKLDMTHVLYYLGGFIAIGAMTLLMTLGWESWGGWGICLISLVYIMIALKLTTMFQSKGFSVPAGICATFVVVMTPLVIYGLQLGLGLWPDGIVYREYHRYIQWYWVYMELGTLAVGVVMVWKYPYPFLMMPIAVTLWYMSMDFVAMMLGSQVSFELRLLVSMYFGVLIVLLAFWVDIRSRNHADYAFWLYLFGIITFWGGMSLQYSDSELSKFVYFCVNILMIGVGVLLLRRVFVVFGALGCSIYLGYLAFNVFAKSWFFPIILTAIGFMIVYLGVVWQKNEVVITRRLRKFCPPMLRELLDSRC